MSKIKVAIVYHSTYGHTKRMAGAVAEGVTSLKEADLVMMTAEEAVGRINELDSCDAIIFGTATYMGNMAWQMKKFIEAGVSKWGKRLWANKIAGGFSNSSNLFGDKSNTLAGLFTNAMQQGMIWVGINDLAASNRHEEMKQPDGPSAKAVNRVSASAGALAASFELPADQAPGEGDMETARNYGRRIADITLQFISGRK